MIVCHSNATSGTGQKSCLCFLVPYLDYKDPDLAGCQLTPLCLPTRTATVLTRRVVSSLARWLPRAPWRSCPHTRFRGPAAIKVLCFHGQMGPLLFHKLVPAYESCEGAGVFSFAVCLMNVH